MATQSDEFLDQNLFGTTSVRTVMSELYQDTQQKREFINNALETTVSFLDDFNTAHLMLPKIKDLLECGNNNNKTINALLAHIQKAVAARKGADAGEGDGEDFSSFEAEVAKLRQTNAAIVLPDPLKA